MTSPRPHLFKPTNCNSVFNSKNKNSFHQAHTVLLKNSPQAAEQSASFCQVSSNPSSFKCFTSTCQGNYFSSSPENLAPASRKAGRIDRKHCGAAKLTAIGSHILVKFHCTQPFPFSTSGTTKNFYLDRNHFKLQQFSKMHERALWSLISMTCLIIKSDNLPTVIKSDNLPMRAAFCCFYINPSLLVSFL